MKLKILLTIVFRILLEAVADVMIFIFFTMQVIPLFSFKVISQYAEMLAGFGIGDWIVLVVAPILTIVLILSWLMIRIFCKIHSVLNRFQSRIKTKVESESNIEKKER